MHILLEELLGWISILFIFFIVLITAKKKPEIKNIILVAFFSRALIIILEQYGIIILPDGNSTPSDATRFELIARLWSSGTMFPFGGKHEIYSQQNLLIILDFFENDSLLISRIISIFYMIFGESIMMAKCISLSLGITSVYMVYILGSELWNNRSGTKAAWLAALFPSLILYSAITLREAYVVFFLLTSLISIVRYYRTKSFIYLILSIIGFYISSLFHGPTILGLFIFLFFLIFDILKQQYYKFRKLKLNYISLLLLIIFVLPFVGFYTGYIKISYLGNFEKLADFEYLTYRANTGFHGITSYPYWLTLNNINEIIPKTFIKIFYFLYSPFIWDIKQTSHLVGFFDGTLYIILTCYLLYNWRNIWSNPIARIFLAMFILYIVVYGFGLGNSGTAFRHRSKFIVILILLVAPKLHKLIFSFKKKIYK